jgi:hypothetical protein
VSTKTSTRVCEPGPKTAALLLLVLVSGQARAQGPAQSRDSALAHQRAVAETTVARQSWSHTGAIVGAIGGAAAFGAAFYHYTHRDGAVNGTAGNVGGATVGAAIGAAGGALLGAFIGSLIPKHGKT